MYSIKVLTLGVEVVVTTVPRQCLGPRFEEIIAAPGNDHVVIDVAHARDKEYSKSNT